MLDNDKNPSTEPKRVRQLRAEIIKQIPRFPNNRETLQMLQSKDLRSLLLDYLNWCSRFVPPRQRMVKIEPTLTADRRWKMLRADAKALLEKVTLGEDLRPYMSLGASRYGFTLPVGTENGPVDSWEDKDFLLIVMGYHHFHLSQIIEQGGHTKRTDVVLFAQVTRQKFEAIAFCDHSVFDKPRSDTRLMTPERERLWKLFDRRSSLGVMPGTVYVRNPIASSGHSLGHVELARSYARTIVAIEPKLDSLSSRLELFSSISPKQVKAMKLRWHLNYMDLGLLDTETSTFHVFHYGPM
jgi:hypothetical protein